MDLTKGKEKLKSLFDKTAGVLKSFSPVLKKSSGSLAEKANSLAGRFSVGKRRLMFFACGGFLLLFFILLIGILLFSSREGKSASPDTAAVAAIPAGELFIPDEPDFVPGYLLERPPRRFWSIEDIRPYWKNPEHPELWRDEINKAVDKLMEAVP